MTTCKVLRCPEPATAVFRLREDTPDLTCPVCASHKKRIESGEPWMMDADLGIPTEDGIPQQVGYTILMAEDFPPRLAGHGMALSNVSWEEGYIFHMNLQTAGMPNSQKIWLSRENLESLAETFASFTKPQS